MLDFDSLKVADTYDWLGSGLAAGKHLKCHQSTVSRNIQRFRSLRRDLQQLNCLDLLAKEREIHQRWRFSRGTELRVHAFRWSNHLICRQSIGNWQLNPIEVSETRKGPLDLLINRIIDALCAPFPLIANADPEIISCLPIYTSFLQLLTHKECCLGHEKNVSYDDIGAESQLGALSFVPVEASQCSEQLDATMIGSCPQRKRQKTTANRYWGLALTPLACPSLTTVDHKLEIPYQEYLVILKEWENNPHVLNLLRAIKTSMQTELGNNKAIECVSFIP